MGNSSTTKMFKLLSKTWVLLLTLALISTLAPSGRQNFVNAEDELEDEIDADEIDADEADEELPAEDINAADEEVKTDDYDDLKLDSSPNAETTILFTKPSEQATVGYSFVPAEPFAGRPFGLSINIAYSSEGRVFSESVFNETINIVEVDDGLDGETFFLYIFLAAGIVLLLVLGQQALTSVGKRRGGAVRVETGTTRTSGNVSDDGIDYDWLPKETLNELNKSPKGSPRRSPRLRKSKAGSGSE